jgi:hypothetical protein
MMQLWEPKLEVEIKLDPAEHAAAILEVCSYDLELACETCISNQLGDPQRRGYWQRVFDSLASGTA